MRSLLLKVLFPKQFSLLSYFLTTSTVFSHQTSEVTKLFHSFQILSINCNLHSCFSSIERPLRLSNWPLYPRSPSPIHAHNPAFDLVSNLGLSSHASATYSKSFDLCAPRRSHASFKNHVRLKVHVVACVSRAIFSPVLYLCHADVNNTRLRLKGRVLFTSHATHMITTQRSLLAYVLENTPQLIVTQRSLVTCLYVDLTSFYSSFSILLSRQTFL